MIGLDTNVLVRYIMQDDTKQSAKATQLIESLTSDEPGFIAMVSVVELYWVLTSSYGLAINRWGKPCKPYCVPNSFVLRAQIRCCVHCGCLALVMQIWPIV